VILGGPRREGAPSSGEVSEDADVVRAMYQALEERDAPALARRTDPRITWVHPLVARLPFDGTRRGLQTVLRAAFRRDEDGTGPEVSAETFLEFGDGVLVAGRFLGGPVEEPFLHECFGRGGKVVLIREYPA
jgi:ketosteroid isomerase-like protein